jgi:type IV secretory pathway VirB2 component (pilin)
MREKIYSGVKAAAPVLVLLGVNAVSCYAATSPFGHWFQDMRAEATGVWAICGAIIGLIIGLIGMLMGDHGVKGKFGVIFGVSFALLSVEGIVAYLQSEG